MTSYLPADKWEKGFATSGPIQGHMPLGFDGQIIDDYLGSDYDSTLPAQHDFDPDFYFASHCESLENTPVDYLSGVYIMPRQ